MYRVDQIAQIVDGKVLREELTAPARIWHDSRSIRPGDLFVALPGSRVDGHRFLSQAYASGACAAIVRDPNQAPDAAPNVIVVRDTLAALQGLAASWRQRFSVPIVGITGSNGKTTVKTLLAHLLSGSRLAYAGPKNYNTEIGLPIAILGMPEDVEAGIFELGTEAPGEIAALADILRPSLAILTGIGPSHFATFRTCEAVADEKWTLVSSLMPPAIALINADSPPLRNRVARAPGRTVTVGLDHGEIRGRLLQAVPRLRLEAWNTAIESGLIGSHNAGNLLLAAAAAHRLGLTPESIALRAESFHPIAHRLAPVEAPFGTLLDDSYNANPISTAGALHVLAAWKGETIKRVFVFGEMLDLGEETDRFHREIAQLACRLGIDTIVPIGDHPIKACRLDAAEITVEGEARDAVLRCIDPGRQHVVLVKGSRALGLEHLVEALKTVR